MKRRYLILMAVTVASALGADSTQRESPFACDRAALTPQVRKRHFDVLGPALRGMVQHSRELANGFEFQFAMELATVQLVAEWAAQEHLCCPFFDIDLQFDREGGGFWIRLTGREGVKDFIRSDFARWMKQ